MTKLVKLNKNTYVVTCGVYSVYETCGVSEAVKWLMFCGVKLDAIQCALDDFEKFDNNIADFGVMGGLTFTCNTDLSAA